MRTGSIVFVSMYSASGALLVQSASAFDCYGAGEGETGKLHERFVDTDIAASLLQASPDAFDEELEVRTIHGPRTHRVKRHQGRDPVTRFRRANVHD